MILLSQWHDDEDEQRRSEFSWVRKRNESCGLFGDTFYLDGNLKRWSFGEFLELASQEYRGKVCVVANADIFFDETILSLQEMCRPERLIALTRWEPPFSGPWMIGHLINKELFFSGSQDSWAFIGGEIPPVKLEVSLGTQCCDQLVCGWAVQAGLEVFSPSMSVRSFHVHSKRADRAPELRDGYFGYPEMCAGATGNGLVLCHRSSREPDEPLVVTSTRK